MAKMKIRKRKKVRISDLFLLLGILALIIFFYLAQPVKDEFDKAGKIFLNSEFLRDEWDMQRCPEEFNSSIISIIHIDKIRDFISCSRGPRYSEIQYSPAKFENCGEGDLKNIDNATRTQFSCWFPLDKTIPNTLTNYYAITSACYAANKPGINYTTLYIPCYGYALPHSILYAVVDLWNEKVYY